MIRRRIDEIVAFSPLDCARTFRHTHRLLRKSPQSTNRGTDALRIIYRRRAQRHHRTVQSTERLAARELGLCVSGLLRLVGSAQSRQPEIETAVAGAGFALRRSGRRADGPHTDPRSPTSTHAPWARVRVRSRSMSSQLDYGAGFAGGAALFDIVNVHTWARRRARRTHKVASTPGAASRPFCPFASWLGSSGGALAP